MTDAHAQFIAALPEDGTFISNKKLLDKLGWEHDQYEQVRSELVTKGVVKKGPGQGGTVCRLSPTASSREPSPSAPPVEAVEPSSTSSPSLPPPSNPKEEFALQLHEDIEGRRKANKRTYEQALVEYALEILDEEQFEEPTPCPYEDFDNFSNELRMRIDGYDLHEDDDDERVAIDLFVAHAASPLSVGDNTEMKLRIPTFEGAPVNALFRAARRFAEASRHGLHRELTDNDEARDVARSIHASRNLARINLILITNTEVRQFDRTSESMDGVEIHKRVLDLGALRRLFKPDAIEVDFSVGRPGGIPCVPLPDRNEVYRSFLAVMPGAFLCKLYEQYGQRLLEANVRAYLRAGGKVNKGIIDTIRKSPAMFFAYNNGITATADELVVETSPDGGSTLVRCRNLQVVNGGQTTASLYYAKQRKVSLDAVYVPMKISEVLDRSQSAEVVQRISISANSQNKVNLSDLGANQPFHVTLQSLAEREAPPKGRRWFYERMRGQYQNELAQRTPARKREFQSTFPKEQVLTKTDVARYSMIWDQKPYSVCFGSEKNYQRFRHQLPDNFVPTATWFHELVAKALLTERCDKHVTDSKIPGYKANIVAYTVALLARVRGKETDLDAIWREQHVDADTDKWLQSMIERVRAHITRPPREGMNIGEWSKKEECWKRLVESFAAPPEAQEP